MPTHSRKHVEDLFLSLVDLPRHQRHDALLRLAPDDPDLRDAVERLLRIDDAHDHPDHPAFLDPDDTPPAALQPAAPRTIGNYDIIGTLGEGGMGVVYQARQRSPARTVALKIIRPGFATAELVRRLRREADALGLLQHPGIACIYEAGVATLQGPGQDIPQPYIAMELVRGLPITEHARAHALDTRQRVDLLARVADAVHHAHERGVIHRDLKPRNIFVDDQRQPKVLDFGIAKLAPDASPTSHTLHTGTGNILGTLDYMSPEQVAADPAAVDARTDVYALGAILFELLTGAPPHDLRTTPIPEALRAIRQDDAPHLSSIRRGHQRFDDDLSTIVAKALDKDPLRRYPSAAALADDLRRYLADEPILARPTTALQQIRKFARRHKAIVAAVVASLAALAIGLVGTLLFAARESAARRLAEARLDQATQSAYRASIAAAHAAIESEDHASALRYLDAAPDSLRGWEWKLAHHLATPSDRRIPLRPDQLRPQRLDLGLRLAASDTPDGRIVVWDLWTDAEPPASRILRGELRAITGSSLVAITQRRELVRVDLDTAATTWTLPLEAALGPTPGRELPAVDWADHDDSRLIATNFTRIAVIDARTGTVLHRLDAPPTMAMARLSPDGRTISASGLTESVAIDVQTGTPRWTAQGAMHGFNPDGSRIVIVGQEPGGSPFARITDTRTGREIARLNIFASNQYAGPSLAFSPDGRMIAAHERPATIVVRDADTLEPRHALVLDAAPHRHHFTPDSAAIVAVSDTGAVFRWEIPPRAGWAEHPRWAASAGRPATSPDASRLARAEWGALAMLDARDGRVLWRAGLSIRPVGQPAFNADGRSVAAFDGDLAIVVLDTQTGREQGRHAFPVGSPPVVAIAWCADRRQWVAADEHGTIHAIDAAPASDRPAQTLASLPGRPIALAARRVGGGLAVAMDQADAGASQPALQTSPQTARRWRLTLLDGTAGSRDATLRARPMTLAFSPDGRRIMVGTADGRVDVLDAESLAPLAQLAAGQDGVVGLDTLADGSRVLGLGADGTIRVWNADLSDPAPLASLRTPIRESAVSVRVSPAGDALVVGGYGRSAVLHITRATPEVARALDLARRGTAHAEALRAEHLVAADVARAIEVETGLADDLRAEARRATLALGDSVARLNSDAWAVARDPRATPAQRERSLRVALAAVEAGGRRIPATLNTLGTALFRLDRHEEAREWLERSDEGFVRSGRGRRAATHAVLAMVHHAKGRDREAAASLATARQTLALMPGDRDAAVLIEEAAERLSGPR